MPDQTPAVREQETEQPQGDADAKQTAGRQAPTLNHASMAGAIPPPPPDPVVVRALSDGLAPGIQQAVLARTPVDDLFAIGNAIIDKAQAAGNQAVDNAQGNANAVVDQVQQAVTNVLGDNVVTQTANAVVDQVQGGANVIVDKAQGKANTIIDKGQRGAANIGTAAGVLSSPGGGASSTKGTGGAGITGTIGSTGKPGGKKPSGGAPMIRQGSSGQWVAHAQGRLNVNGPYSLNIDGLFGPATHGATVHYQGAHGLGADGIIGPKTWSALDAPTMFGGDGHLPPEQQVGAATGAVTSKG